MASQTMAAPFVAMTVAQALRCSSEHLQHGGHLSQGKESGGREGGGKREKTHPYDRHS